MPAAEATLGVPAGAMPGPETRQIRARAERWPKTPPRLPQIAALLESGKGCQEIAVELGTKKDTIKTQIGVLFRQLGIPRGRRLPVVESYREYVRGQRGKEEAA